MHTQKGQVFTELVLDIFKLGGLLVAEGDRLSGNFGVTSARWKVLGAIALSPKPLTVAQIAKNMGQTRQGVQRIADSLAEEGVVIYEDNPAHKKAKLLLLTDKGREIYGSLENIQAPWANQIAEKISLGDLTKTQSILRKLIAELER